MEWIKAIVLGVVQGITEFLPISSDGHLVITQNLFDWLSGKGPSDENLFFDVILHLGTTVAILVYYRREIATGLRGLLGAEDVPDGFRRPQIIHLGILAAVATAPLVPLALFFMKPIKESFKGITMAGVGFLITATILLLTAWLSRRDGTKGPAETKWWHALLIGLAQTLAPLPGVSRSGTTIATGLALGLSRPWAVGFSLMMAVPAILGAVAKEVLDMVKDHAAPPPAEYIAQALAATIVAGLVGYAAITWLVRIVRSGRIWYFSVYLIVVGTLVLAVAIRGGSANAGRSSSVDGTVRGGQP